MCEALGNPPFGRYRLPQVADAGGRCEGCNCSRCEKLKSKLDRLPKQRTTYCSGVIRHSCCRHDSGRRAAGGSTHLALVRHASNGEGGKQSAANYEEARHNCGACRRRSSVQWLIEERQLRVRHISGGSGHDIDDVDDDSELDSAGDAGHEYGVYDHQVDDEEIDDEEGSEESELLSRATRTDTARRSGPTPRRATAVVGVGSLSALMV